MERLLFNTRWTSTLPKPLLLLILGGTSEGTALARALVGVKSVAATVSLAGRTREPVAPPLPFRVGGFGGADGLARTLAAKGFDAVVDATHPFASRISANAQAACSALGLPLATFTRPPWQPEAGDRWTMVDTLDTAARALGPAPLRAFLTTGRLGLAAFRAAPQHHYLIRTIDPPEAGDLPPRCRLIEARGPFSVDDEAATLRDERVDVLVTKNSGGEASVAKLLAARRLGLPVIMVTPPARPETTSFTDLRGLLGWIAGLHRGEP